MTVHTSRPFAAGNYYVGDPCYGFNDATPDWMMWLESADFRNQNWLLEGEVRGSRITAVSTKYGDGLYCDNDGWMYGVDAGMIGVIHEKSLVLEGDTNKVMLHLVKFDEPFTVSTNSETGQINIGHITIETGDDVDENGNPFDEEDEDTMV